MFVYDDLREYELRERGGCWKPCNAIEFRTREEALAWLVRHSCYSLFLLGVRRLVASHVPAGCFRLSDRDVLELAASKLYRGSLVLRLEREWQPVPATYAAPDAPAASPVAEPRRPALRTIPDPPTFSPNLEAAAQSRVLVAAARQGTPFCPI
jgi:hypothetical protein